MNTRSNHKPKVAVVLLAYNSLHLVKNFLPLIIKTTPDDQEHEIVVVDNASTDGLGDWMNEHHPNIRVVTIEENHGFTNGYQESLPQIEAHHYVLISSDIEVTPGWLENGLKLLESDDQIAAVQPKIKSHDRKDEFEYAGAAGGMMDFWGYPFCRGRILDAMEKDEGQYESQMELFWASGACLFINAEIYLKSGGLDNDYFAHFEEIDLAWRLQRMGYKLMYCPNSEVYHMGGSIIKYGSPGKVYRNHRNSLITLIKNAETAKLLWLLPLRFVLDVAAFFMMIAQGQAKSAFAVPKAHRDIILLWPEWMKKRKELAHLPRSSKMLKGLYKGSIVVDYYFKGIRKYSKLKL